jgi:hypothetical protein
VRTFFVIIVILSGVVLYPSFAAEDEMVGPVTREALFEKFPEWQAVAAAYQPQPDCVDKLRSWGQEVRIAIYFGTWCSDSKAHVSEFFKVLDLVDSPLFRPLVSGSPRTRTRTSGRLIIRVKTS